MPVNAAPSQQLTPTSDLALASDLFRQISEFAGEHGILSPVKFIEMMGLNLDAFATNAHAHPY